MAKSKAKTEPGREAEVPPEWFTDGAGNRLGVSENELARSAWFAERGLADPARESAGRVAARLKDIG